MDDDDLPSAATAPPDQPPFPTYDPGWCAAPAAAAAADPKLGFLDAKIDDCDVWDGVPEGEEEEVGKAEIGAVTGEEDDLMLDMLRSQQDGQFIIGGEDVLASAGLVSEFAVKDDGGDAVMDVEIGGMEESTPNSAGLQKEAVDTGVCGIAEVNLLVKDGAEVAMGAGEEGGEVIIGEVEMAGANIVVDTEAVKTLGVDNSIIDDCRADDCAGDAVKQVQGDEVGAGIEMLGAVSISEMPVLGGQEVGLAGSSSPKKCKEVGIFQPSLPQVGEEVGGEPSLPQVSSSAQGGEEVGGEDPSSPQGSEKVGGMDLGATDTAESEKETAHLIDDSQILDATTPAVETTGQEDGTPSAPVNGTEAAVTDVSQMDADNSGNVPTKGPGAGRKKRGRQPKAQTPKPFKKKGEEDVCFICFDGGDLVVCDRRGCPKVYHPSCVNRDEAFFRAKGRWNCGWHICSICEKAAQYMCYTCTYSLCKGCIKESEFVCIRGNKGLCVTCRGMVMIIETNDPAAVNFYDKSSWEHLFKDYWTDVKEKLSITFDEITKGKRPSKKAVVRNEESSDDAYEANEGAASSSDSSSGRGCSTKSKKKAKRRKAVTSNESSVTVVDSAGSSVPGDGDWASKELLEFVSHMKDGDSSVLSQFDVQALLLEYIKRNNLRDPRRKSQIICDSRLENLFGKTRVGHFEMLKLLESHFLIKESSHFAAEDDHMAIGDHDVSRMDAEGCSDATKMISEKRRKGRRKEDREPQTNFDDYAAIDVHNISLIYLRRNLMEDLIDDTENFNGKVVGSFVRIRITASGQRQDMYRLVKVIGTTKAPEKYQAGKKTTDFLLEILNLNKTEVMSIDTISNQEFTEEECKRLRQSIKIGFIPRMTVGELQEKARDLQTLRVNDWLETEKARLSHLRDRASETGRRKELRECVEKLDMLPEEHLRKLSETPEVHSDPNMDPNYVSAEEEPDDRKQDSVHNRHRGSGYYRKGKDAGSSEKSIMPVDWITPRKGLINTSEPRNEGDGVGVTDTSLWGRSKDVPQQNSSEMQSNRGSMTPQNSRQSLQAAGQAQLAANISVSTPSLLTRTTATTGSSINESEKVWHYQDPTGKIQGPFSMVQLRKWNSTGYFPRDLRIWKASEKQEDSILLSDALIGKFEKDLPVCGTQKQSGFQTSNPTKVMDSSDINRNRLGQSDHDQIKSDGWSAVMKTTNASTVPAIVGMAGVQDHAVAWNSGRSTMYPSNGPSYDRHTHTTGSSFQHLPVQQANFQPVALGPNLGLGANRPPANIISPTTNSNMVGSSQGNQSRVRVSRWEPEAVSTSMHGAQTGNEVPRKSEPTLASGHVAALLPPMDSPTPKNEQLSGFPVANDHQKTSSSIADPLPLQGISSLDSSAIAKNAGLPGHDKSTLETVSQKRELQNADSLAGDPNSEKNFSPIRTDGSGVSIVNPDIAAVDVNNSNWSLPSPTPSSEVAQMDAGAQIVSVNNAPAFSDSNRFPASVQMNSDSSIGPAPQTIMPQTPGLLVNQNSGWAYAPDNSGMGVISTQASAGWGTQLPPNANMTWVAPGTSNVVWTPLPQGNTNVVGWGPAAAGTQIVNTVPQVAGTGTMPPVAGWGPVAQVVAPANASWGTSIQQANVNPGWGTAVQGFPNANPGRGVPQPASTDQNMGWVGPIPGNPSANVAWGMSNGNLNAGWNSPSGNPNNWGPHQKEQDRYNRNPNNGDSGHGGGRHRMHSSGGQSWDPNGPRGICRFHENGHCKKGASCNFLHT